jgi:beta-glucuronidase
VWPIHYAACYPGWIENAYEYMASCGQGCWYHDETANILYYIPRTGENMATVPVVAPRYAHLVTGSGVNGLTFQHITFAYAADNDTSSATGYTGVQAGYSCGNLSPPTSGCNGSFSTTTTFQPLDGPIRFSASSKNVTFDHNLFTHIGGRALFGEHTSQNLTITANKFVDNGGGCLQWGDITAAQSSAALQTSGLVFRNNYCEGPFEYDATWMLVPYSTGGVIDRNEFAGYTVSMGYGALQMGWGWGPPYPGTVSYQGGTAVTNNYVHGYCGNLPDCGGIYWNGPFTSYSASGNYLVNRLMAGGTGFYSDNSSSNGTWTGNVQDDNMSIYWAGCNNCSNVTFGPGNYYTNASTFDTDATTFKGNTPFTSGSPPLAAQNIINASGVQPGVTPGP